MGKIEEFYESLGDSVTSCLRLTVKVEEGRKTHYFYDRGARVIEDPTHILGPVNDWEEPRFLEDIMNAYPEADISIREWGKYNQHRDDIENIIGTRMR